MGPQRFIIKKTSRKTVSRINRIQLSNWNKATTSLSYSYVRFKRAQFPLDEFSYNFICYSLEFPEPRLLGIYTLRDRSC
jgi:hypothetical protein